MYTILDIATFSYCRVFRSASEGVETTRFIDAIMRQKKQCDIALNLAKTVKTNYFLCNDRFRISQLRDTLSKRISKLSLRELKATSYRLWWWCNLDAIYFPIILIIFQFQTSKSIRTSKKNFEVHTQCQIKRHSFNYFSFSEDNVKYLWFYNLHNLQMMSNGNFSCMSLNTKTSRLQLVRQEYPRRTWNI